MGRPEKIWKDRVVKDLKESKIENEKDRLKQVVVTAMDLNGL